MCQAWQEIPEDTRNEGFAIGEACIAALFEKLYYAGRMEDISRACNDKTYRAALLQEMRLFPSE